MQQYIVTAWDGTDERALERRMKARPMHLQGAAELKAKGNFVIGGAVLNDEGRMIGSMMIVQFENEAELQHWLDIEPYLKGDVWKNIDVRPFKVAAV